MTLSAEQLLASSFKAAHTAAVPDLPADFKRWLVDTDPDYAAGLDWCWRRGLLLGVDGIKKLIAALKEFLA